MDSGEIRESFLRFFEERDHLRLPSWPLVPYGDPTLLFTSAGMVQFKRYFMGEAEPPSRRLTTVQKCFRTSDIDSVGDPSHLTFFEMLGNFSIGDYFKERAIAWAWEYVTEVLKLSKERLWAAVFLDDDEAFDLWKARGVPEERLMRYGEGSNYWFSGPVGPCGPCSEIHYDFGPTPGCKECEAGTCHPDVGCGRFLEIWNLVFMSFYQHEDGSRTPLPTRNIDTGAGLERLAVVNLHNETGQKPTVYDTDVFRPALSQVEELAGREYGREEAVDRAMRVVAEHARAAAFLIADGVTPSNDGRGYVLRRILRRAVYFGQQLGLAAGALLRVAEVIIDKMRGQYPELAEHQDVIIQAIRAEEEKFRSIVQTGTQILQAQVFPPREWLKEANSRLLRELERLSAELAQDGSNDRLWRDALSRIRQWRTQEFSESVPSDYLLYSLPLWEATMEAMDGDLRIGETLNNPSSVSVYERADFLHRLREAVQNWQSTVSGREAFILADTHGFPKELTEEIAREHGMTIDDEGFERLMEEQRARGRAAARFGPGDTASEAYAALPGTVFVGYERLRHDTRMIAITKDGKPLEVAGEGDEVEVVLSETSFYPEGGGQVADVGEIIAANGRMLVTDTQRVIERPIVHRGCIIEGRIAVGDAVTAQVDPEHRYNVMRNHTATHLLHAALRQVLGSHVRQAGSLVAPDRLRFDFSHMEAMRPEEILQVQHLVNEKIRADLPVRTRQTTFQQAMDEGILAFFDEKYGDKVRVVEALEDGGRFSGELCGGTHCSATGQIGYLLITNESGIGAGMRRIEAVTGRGAEAYIQRERALIEEIANKLNTDPPRVSARVESLLEELSETKRRLETLERQRTRGGIDDYLARVQEIDGVRVLASPTDTTNMKLLRELGDVLKSHLADRFVIALSAVIEGEPRFITMVSQDLVNRGIKAGDIVGRVASVAGGSGGGRADMAQGGGRDVSKVAEALQEVPNLVREKLLGH